MKPELIVIDTAKGLTDLIAYLEPFEYVAFDTETTGITKHSRVIGMSVCAEENKAFYIILDKWNNETKQLYTVVELLGIGKLLHLLKSKKLIMHNSVFDCMIVNSNFKIDLMPSLHTDTMILAHLLDENRRVGLKELAASMYGEDSTLEAQEMKASVVKNGGKLTKTQYEMYKCDSYIMAKYGAKDALLTYKLFLSLVPELFKQNLDKFFYDEESMPLLRGPTYDLNTIGLQVDSKKLMTLKKTLEAECAELKAYILTETKERVAKKYEKFNIGSNQQLSWLLFCEYGLEFGVLTKAGKTLCKQLGMKVPYTRSAKNEFIAEVSARVDQMASMPAIVNGVTTRGKKIKEPWSYLCVDKKVLAKIAPKLKWVAKLLEYQKKMKLLSTYVEGIEKRIQYGIIQPSFLQHGTSSGRYASRNPNFQNLPRDDRRIKECIISRPGRVFVGADYSQLEPRTFAYFSGDERLREAFNDGSDFYSVVGREVYHKLECLPLKEGNEKAFGVCYPNLRQDTKVFVLASTYGATGHQLAPLMNKTADEAQEDINNYFEEFPKVASMMQESHRLAKEQGFVTNLYGRPRRMPDAMKIDKIYGKLSHAELPYEARKLLNLAVNHRIQSTAASIVNRSAIKLYYYLKECQIDAKIVLQVHDSLIVECKEEDAGKVAGLMQSAMENTCKLEGIPLEAKPKIGRTLADV